MNNNFRPNMSIEDSENNNVDENSNDHQYNQYANYHTQFHHGFRNPLLPNNSLPRVDNFYQDQANFHQRSETERLQDTSDEVDSRVNARYSNSLPTHRRNLSEDLSVNSNHLPPLPTSNYTGTRDQMLNINSHHLPTSWLSRLPRRNDAATLSDEVIRDESEQLLYRFTAEQLEEEHIDPRPLLGERSNPRSCDFHATLLGRQLRNLADDFSRSQERRKVRRRAQQVDMGSLSATSFFELCQELFNTGKGGITQERIVVLFTFISDVAIEQVKQRAERFISQLMDWSLRFIFEHICAWVREAGGWEVVLSKGVNFVYKISFCMLATVSIVALAVFIKKNWREL